ncbi:SIS domain-containing protein [Ancylobacter sp. SL191]|uniref:SIS domain-containing protein n=1 Tax=Ancylobacter sp. SL191 TaxID=2995166 RepID=UPI00226D94AC|nr:SIS domain-containing protein [Ancylobacter sp. SL191]WAC26091.1 SIS domain-containing protein [Ancylobacter sp. SL191]
MIDLASRLKALTAEPSRDTANDPARLARVERTRSELFGQGGAIRQTLDLAAPHLVALAQTLANRPLSRMIVVGCGDSWFAGKGVRHALEAMTGLPAEAIEALDYAAYESRIADDATLVVGISSGGNTPAVMQALRAAAERGAFCIGISNTAGSPILTEFDAALQVHATRKGWPTQSTNATMALLIALGAALPSAAPARETMLRDLADLPEIIDRLCRELDADIKALAERWASAELVLYSGLGPNFAAASIGAAKLRELSPVHAFALPLEEYHHYRTQKAGDPLVLVATDAASAERALDTALVAEEVGGPILAILAAPARDIETRAAAVIRVPETPAALAAMVSIVPLHLLAYHYATARAALGLGAAVRPPLE